MNYKRLNVGVIGAGAISDIYIQNMNGIFSDRLKVTRASAAHIESAEKKAAQYGLQACTTEELLASPDVDLAVILTPVGSHGSLIRQALEAGKHVYTEKTLTDDLQEAAALVKLAGEKGLYLASAPDTFLGSALQTARKAVDDGVLGDIHSFVISANRNNNILLSMFSFLRQPGAGILYDYAVYYMTALVSLLGPVARVGGIIGRPYPTHVNVLPQSPDFGKAMDTPNESQVSAILQLRNGVTGTLHLNADCVMQDQAFFALYGTKGILYLSDANQFGGEIRFLPDMNFETREPGKEKKLTPFPLYQENSRGLGPWDLSGAIQEGRPCRASGEMAYHVMEVLTGILQGGPSGAFREILSTCDRPAPWVWPG